MFTGLVRRNGGDSVRYVFRLLDHRVHPSRSWRVLDGSIDVPQGTRPRAALAMVLRAALADLDDEELQSVAE